jgi:hypothetical protein
VAIAFLPVIPANPQIQNKLNLHKVMGADDMISKEYIHQQGYTKE